MLREFQLYFILHFAERKKETRENYKKVQQEIGAILGETAGVFAQKK